MGSFSTMIGPEDPQLQEIKTSLYFIPCKILIHFYNLWMKVLRDGRWTEQDASILVPGDVISIKLGDIVPADARLLEGDPLKIDQAALTGESLPVTRNPGDEVFSGSTCKQGEIEAVVIATGVHTFFGKAAHLVDSTNQVGHFQKVWIISNDHNQLHHIIK